MYYRRRNLFIERDPNTAYSRILGCRKSAFYIHIIAVLCSIICYYFVYRYLADNPYREPEVSSIISEEMMNTGVGRYLIENSAPSVSIDEGVGDLIEIAANRGKKQNKKLKLGICGEHGGDPKSIYFCSKIGLDYVSCSPYRVPVAKLAAAQAELKKS